MENVSGSTVNGAIIYGELTAFCILTIFLKLLINREATELDHMETVFSIPGEITILVAGFILSQEDSGNGNNNRILILMVLLIILVFQLCSERSEAKKFSDGWTKELKKRFLLMLFLSVVTYGFVVLGGLFL